MVKDRRISLAQDPAEHPIFKLGKASAIHDPRTLRFASLATPTIPPPPLAYDFDTSHIGIPTPMFDNDTYGCCVIAGRAHQTLRFENLEQGSLLMIQDKDVLREYEKETGGPDTGLVVLDSLKLWRSVGWKVGRLTYKIKAFSSIPPKDHLQIKQAIYLDVGVGLGLNLPLSAQSQMQTGQAWDVVKGRGSAPGSWGGHYVFVPGYNEKGPVCVTWGQKQQMTWAWLDKYADEAYAIFDAKDSPKRKLIQAAKIEAYVKELGSKQQQKETQ